MGPTLTDCHHLVLMWQIGEICLCVIAYPTKKYTEVSVLDSFFSLFFVTCWKISDNKASKTLPQTLSALPIHESETASVHVTVNDFMLMPLCISSSTKLHVVHVLAFNGTNRHVWYLAVHLRSLLRSGFENVTQCININPWHFQDVS